MSNVEGVRMTGQDTSHWKVKGPLGKSARFEAWTTEVGQGRGIGWNTIGGNISTSGEERFEEVAPGRTRIEVAMNSARTRLPEPTGRPSITPSPTPSGTRERICRTSPESRSAGGSAVPRPRHPAAKPKNPA